MRGMAELFGDRPDDAKKTDFGSVGVIGGAKAYPSTPAIPALAALRTGADLAFVAAPERAADASASFAPDLITRPVGQDRLHPDDVDDVLDAVSSCSVLVIGNGLGHKRSTIDAVETIVQETDVPLVLDADALRADIRELDTDDREVIVTPHRGEFERLYGEPADQLGAIKEQVRKASHVLGTTVVLKGPVDVVSDGADIYANFSGNPFMTKGGTGDVLAGICGALLSRTTPMDAGRLGTAIAGTAGDLVAEEMRQSFLLEEMLAEIGPAIADLTDQD
jgi:NAD(P)H-hydrate epimerase